jgi:hypothetical protein
MEPTSSRARSRHSRLRAANPPQPAPPSRSRGARLARLSLGLGLVLATFAQAYEIRNGTVAGGGAIVAADDFLLISTMGEPAMGTVSSGPFRLTSGFPATLAGDAGVQPIGGPIFKDGFERSGSN